MLAVTADNATANDVMIDELQELIASFRGQATRVQCFDHTLNLIVKTLLRQFDVARDKKGSNKAALDAAWAALQDLAGDELEDDDGNYGTWEIGEDGEEMEADNVEGWVDERRSMSEEEVAELELTTRLAKLVLAKVFLGHSTKRYCAHQIVALQICIPSYPLNDEAAS